MQKTVEKLATAKRQILNARFDCPNESIEPMGGSTNRNGHSGGVARLDLTHHDMPSVKPRGFFRYLAIAALAVFAIDSGTACATIITFETVSNSNSFFNLTKPVTEAGFTYSLAAGNLNAYFLGNPGWEMEGDQFRGGNEVGGGTLAIVSATPGGLFTFNGLDTAVVSSLGPDGKPITLGITVTGNRQGSFVSTDLFLQAGSPTGKRVWISQTSLPLAGKPIDELLIRMPALFIPFSLSGISAIDNVKLEPVQPVPLPGSAMLFGSALLSGLGLAGRRRMTGQVK